MIAPFPYFGGKKTVSDAVWARFGDVPNYVEPFFGSGAVLLARPHEPRIETVNDLDCYLSNFWRALKHDPDGVAEWADWPVSENDLHARHAWLVAHREETRARMEGDPDYYDTQRAGWWVWGLCCWIGSGWCSGQGPWRVVDNALVKDGNAGRGINRKLPHLGDAGRGINRQRRDNLQTYMQELSDRLRNARVCCGDWQRVLGPTPTTKQGLTAVFLDPPYGADAKRDNDLYAHESQTVAGDVRAWAIEHGADPKLRIALCGYADEHTMPQDWECYAWKASGGYASQGDGSNKNCHEERIWFSPHCLRVDTAKQLDLEGTLCH